MSPVCQLSSAIPLDQVSLLLKDHPAIKAKTKQVNIGSTGNHCKCLCKIETKEDELMETLEVAKEKNWKRKLLLWSKAFDFQFKNKQLNILDCFETIDQFKLLMFQIVSTFMKEILTINEQAGAELCQV